MADCNTGDWKVLYGSCGVDAPESVFGDLYVANKVVFFARLRHPRSLPLIQLVTGKCPRKSGELELPTIKLALLAIHIKLLPSVLDI